MNALNDALKEMKAARRPGLLIVLPDDFQFLLGEFSNRLEQLFGPWIDATGWPSRAVYACVRAKEAKARVGDTSTLIALDPDGKKIGARDGDLMETLNPGPFSEAVDALLAAYPPAPPPAELKAPKLPYGVEWAQDTHQNLFGTSYDPCPPCGMPRMDANAQELIRYLKLLAD